MLTRLPRFHAPTWYQQRCGSGSSSGDFPGLAEDLDTGILVIGGGLAGLSTALSLVERGYENIALIERGQPGEGASGRNGGFVFAGFSLDAEALVASTSRQHGKTLYGLTREAVGRVRARCEALGVALDGQGVLQADWFDQPDRMQAARDALDRAVEHRMDWIEPDDIGRFVVSDRYGGGLFEPDAFHFNPLAYVLAVSRTIHEKSNGVFSNTPATSIQRIGPDWIVDTPRARIRAKRVVLATGGYDRSLIRPLARALQPVATYISVTRPLGDLARQLIPGRAAIYDNRFAFDYYRRVDDRILWGGRISMADRAPDAITRLMKRDMARVFPDLGPAGIEYSWGGWMSYARHQMPVLSELEPGMWIAAGFGGHGLATTTLAGDVLARALTGAPERMALFVPWKPVWAGGMAGRGAIQGIYWWKQLRDRARAGRTRRRDRSLNARPYR